jgi:hypothetical protein
MNNVTQNKKIIGSDHNKPSKQSEANKRHWETAAPNAAKGPL